SKHWRGSALDYRRGGRVESDWVAAARFDCTGNGGLLRGRGHGVPVDGRLRRGRKWSRSKARNKNRNDRRVRFLQSLGSAAAETASNQCEFPRRPEGERIRNLQVEWAAPDAGNGANSK